MPQSNLDTLLPAGALERVRAPLSQAWTLPPAAYTDPAVYRLEEERLFASSWQCVARVEQLKNPGDFITVDLPQHPIVVVRDLNGELHATSRICVHRAMPVATGCGNARRFVCPYHNWTYELDGQLRSAPMMDGVEEFDAAAWRLAPLSLEVWEGFVFVNPDTEAAPLAPQLAGLDKLIERYDFAELEVAETLHFDSPWNWKILTENFMEAYHHIGTHRQTFEPVYPARDASVPDNEGAPWSFLHMPGKHQDEAPSSFPRLNEEERSTLFAACIFPNFLFAASSTSGAWYQLHPRAHDQMDLKIHILLHPSLREAMSEENLAEMRAMFHAIHTEDIEANAGPWHGLQAAGTRQGRLSTFEKSIWQLNQLWLDAMAGSTANA